LSDHLFLDKLHLLVRSKNNFAQIINTCSLLLRRLFNPHQLIDINTNVLFLVLATGWHKLSAAFQRRDTWNRN